MNWGEVGRALWPVGLGAVVLLVGLGRGGRQQMAHFAIMAAFKAGRDLAGAGLNGVSDGDLAKLALSAYTALPGVVLVAGAPVPVGLLKLFLSEGAWEKLVQGQYRRFAGYYHATVTARETPPPAPGVRAPLPVTMAAIAQARGGASGGAALVVLPAPWAVPTTPTGPAPLGVPGSLPAGLVGATPGVAPPVPAPGAGVAPPWPPPLVVGEGVV